MNIYENIYNLVEDKLGKYCPFLSKTEKSEIAYKIVVEIGSELPNIMTKYFEAFYCMKPLIVKVDK